MASLIAFGHLSLSMVIWDSASRQRQIILSSLSGKYWFQHCQYSTHYRDVFPGIHWQQSRYQMKWPIRLILSNTVPVPWGVYREIPPEGQYFPIHSLEWISGLHPHAGIIVKAPAMIQSGTLLIYHRQAKCEHNGCKWSSLPKEYKQNIIELVLM